MFCIKGSVSRDFWPPFFHDSNPSSPLINRLKYFQMQFWFCWDFRIFKKLRSVHHTAESSSAVCIIAWGVHPSVESWKKVSKITSVCIIPPSQTPRCVSYRGVSNLPSVCLIRNFTIVISFWCWYYYENYYTERHKLFQESFLLQTFFL